MWLVAIVAIGVVLYAAAGSPRASSHRPPGMAGVPGPIAVFGEFIRAGRRPPDQVILFAIAEAESIGRNDLAHDIVKVFVAPVVYQHEMARARAATPAQVSEPYQPAPANAPGPILHTDEEIRTMLNADPKGFVDDVARGRSPRAPKPPVIDVDVADVREVKVPDEPTQLSSPIVGVDPVDWSRFCNRLERETPVYQSSRHVGQYRQRKERLLELGIDPRTLLGSALAQRSALDTDLADAHHHAHASGLANDHVHRRIVIPGQDDPATVTLSGVLGVIQAAGLGGAVGWFETAGDRKRFPHTTQAFIRTNGVF